MQAEVRYVLSGQPTGWAAMAGVTREFDEEKIQDCKEDIDTLLVFVSYHERSMQSATLTDACKAGLFSAVLVGFVVVSYMIGKCMTAYKG